MNTALIISLIILFLIYLTPFIIAKAVKILKIRVEIYKHNIQMLEDLKRISENHSTAYVIKPRLLKDMNIDSKFYSDHPYIYPKRLKNLRYIFKKINQALIKDDFASLGDYLMKINLAYNSK